MLDASGPEDPVDVRAVRDDEDLSVEPLSCTTAGGPTAGGKPGGARRGRAAVGPEAKRRRSARTVT